MPWIEVGCAIIQHQGKLLIAQRRPSPDWGGYWEFPGGKRWENESMEDCLVREAAEELGVRITPKCFLARRPVIDRNRRLMLEFYLCDWSGGVPVRRECLNWEWVRPTELRRFNFLPADTEIINHLIQMQGYYFSPRVRPGK